VFADLGQAWNDGEPRGGIRKSFGGELSIDGVVGYVLPLTVTAGVARRDDPAAGRRDTVGFVRIGRAF
jgi:hypothetical protein